MDVYLVDRYCNNVMIRSLSVFSARSLETDSDANLDQCKLNQAQM